MNIQVFVEGRCFSFLICIFTDKKKQSQVFEAGGNTAIISLGEIFLLPNMNLVILQTGIVQRTMVLYWHMECKGTHRPELPLNLCLFKSYQVTFVFNFVVSQVQSYISN